MNKELSLKAFCQIYPERGSVAAIQALETANSLPKTVESPGDIDAALCRGITSGELLPIREGVYKLVGNRPEGWIFRPYIL